MEPVEVYVGEAGNVVLKQTNGAQDDSLIFLAAEQVDMVCQWLQEVKAEALAARAAGEA